MITYMMVHIKYINYMMTYTYIYNKYIYIYIYIYNSGMKNK